MKNFLFLIAMLLSSITFGQLSISNSFLEATLRFSNVQVNQASNTLTVDIEGKSLEDFAYQTGAWSFRFTYNDAVLSTPRVSLPNPVGGSHTILQQTGPNSNIITSYGILSVGPVATLQINSWTTLGRIEFDLANFNPAATNHLGLVWETQYSNTPTTGNQWIANPNPNHPGNQRALSIIEVIDLNDYLPSNSFGNPSRPARTKY